MNGTENVVSVLRSWCGILLVGRVREVKYEEGHERGKEMGGEDLQKHECDDEEYEDGDGVSVVHCVSREAV